MHLAAPQGNGNLLATVLPFVLIIGVFWFFMIRPQAKKRREAMQMQNSLGPGAEVITIGGLHGTVVGVEDDKVALEIAPGVVVRFVRAAIGQVKSPGVSEPDEAAGTGEATAAAEPAVGEPVQSPVVETRKKD